ncbi:MAG: hypothetical protein R3F43_02950 [bacterium]
MPFADNCGLDIAVLVLTQPIPAAEAQPLELRLDGWPRAGERFTAVGTSATTPGRHAAQHHQPPASARGPTAPRPTATATELVGNDGTCQGDSGGPGPGAQGARPGGPVPRGRGLRVPRLRRRLRVGGLAEGPGARGGRRGGYRALDWAEPPVADAADGDGVADEDDNCPGRPTRPCRSGRGDGQGDALTPGSIGSARVPGLRRGRRPVAPGPTAIPTASLHGSRPPCRTAPVRPPPPAAPTTASSVCVNADVDAGRPLPRRLPLRGGGIAAAAAAAAVGGACPSTRRRRAP